MPEEDGLQHGTGDVRRNGGQAGGTEPPGIRRVQSWAKELAAGRGADAVGLADLLDAVVLASLDPEVLDAVMPEFGRILREAVGTERLDQLTSAPRQTPVSSLEFSSDAKAILDAANDLAWSMKTATFERHLLSAALGAPKELGSEVKKRIERYWQDRWGVQVDGLLSSLREHIQIAHFYSKTPATGLSLLRLFGEEHVATAAFVADQPGGDDALGRRADARRLAELACLRANAPPLAIGVFGDWGTGKSTFLRLMEQEVEAIAARWRNERNTPFVTRVAQITFNAWVHAGGDLWVALADRIFEGLEQHAAASGHPFRFDRSLELVAAFNPSGELTRRIDELKTAKTESGQWEEEVAKAREELEELEKERQDVLREAAQDAVTRLAEDVRRALRNLAPERASEVDALAEAAEHFIREGNSLLAQLRVVWRAGSFATRLLLSVLLGGVVALSLLSPVVDAVATWFLVVAAALAPLLGPARTALGVLDAVRAVMRQPAERLRDLEARMRKAEAHVLQASRARQQAESRRKEAESAAERERRRCLEGHLSLSEAAVEARTTLVSQRGVRGRLHDTFRTLDARMRARPEPSAGLGEEDLSLPPVDRIVVYIDDLDRCDAKSVVAFLEAVGLLLAQTRLFVVVVAVDARWLTRALKAHYGAQFGEDGAGPGEYLEKIFQVPFWLPRLAADDPGHGALARTLIRDVHPIEATSNVREDSDALAASATLVGPEGRERGGIDPDERPQSGDEARREPPASVIRRVQLTEPEARLLEALFPIAGSTPRAIKRFVNLYRLARSLRTGGQLDSFLGTTDGKARYVTFAFLLAVVNGAHHQDIRTISAALRGRNDEETLHLSPIFLQQGNALGEALRRTFAAMPNFAAINWPSLGVGEIRKLIDEARRLSFHPPEFDPTPLPDKPRADSPGA